MWLSSLSGKHLFSREVGERKVRLRYTEFLVLEISVEAGEPACCVHWCVVCTFSECTFSEI